MNYKHYLDSCNHVGTFYNKHYLDQWLSEYNGFFNGRPLSSDFIEAMAVLKDDIYSSISKEYWPHITDRLLSCALNESGKYSHDAIVVFTVVSVEASFLGVNKSYSSQQKVKAAHGGKREGAGRPSKAPTRQIRVPEQMIEELKALCSVFPAYNPDCECESEMTPKDHLAIEVLNVLDALKCYVETNLEAQSHEGFKYKGIRGIVE